jgi:hypothetical protein
MMRSTEWVWVAGMWIVGAALLAGLQPVTTFSNGLGYDGVSYHAVASRLLTHQEPQAAAPFVYRVGTPWLAASVTRLTGWPLITSFERVNLAASLGGALLLMRWLRRHVSNGRGRWLVLIFFLSEPHSPLRSTFFYPVNVDPLATMFLLAGLNLIDWIRSRPTLLRIACMGAVVMIGVTVREVVLVAAVALMFTRLDSGGSLARLRLSIPLACGLLAFAGVRAWVVVEPSPYSFLSGVFYWLRWKTPAQLMLAPLLVFGPLIVLPLWFSGELRSLKVRLDWLVYLACFGALAWIGGSDTERILVFGSPVVWLLIAAALNRITTSQGWRLGFAVVAELLSFRVFVPIGGPPLVANIDAAWSRLPSSVAWLSNYESFWSFSLTREEIVALAGWYGLVMMILLIWLWRQTRATVLIEPGEPR